MLINKNSQLALMFWDRPIMLEFLIDFEEFLKNRLNTLEKKLHHIKEIINNDTELDELQYDDTLDGDRLYKEISRKLGYSEQNKGSEFYLSQNIRCKYYLIQSTVEECAGMIKIKDNFSCIIFNKIPNGEHIYMLGKNEMYRFVKSNDAIRASYWNKELHKAFEFGFLLDEDLYYFPTEEQALFNRMVKLMTFVEIGDIETTIIEAGRNNGKTKKNGKIVNATNYTVFVVDSSWNKIIIRTDGFAVKGHFRLQPCGVNFCDRKLVWISAFEKHGYTRRPKAAIIND